MVFDADVNFLAVLLAGIAAQPLGALWYSRSGLGEAWMRLRGYTMDDVEGGHGSSYAIVFLAAILTAYVLSRVVDMVGADSVLDCIGVAALLWAGFAMPVQGTQIIFTPRAALGSAAPLPGRFGLLAVESGYQLASFLIMGAIIGAFQ
jgi:Protein of unknown function (DUF1761)